MSAEFTFRQAFDVLLLAGRCPTSYGVPDAYEQAKGAVGPGGYWQNAEAYARVLRAGRALGLPAPVSDTERTEQ